MEIPSYAPESVRRTRRAFQHSRRHEIPLNDLNSRKVQFGKMAEVERLSIVLIDPKPLTRQSLLEMLTHALPSRVTLFGVSSYQELTDHKPPWEFIILYIRNAGITGTWVQEQLRLIRDTEPYTPVVMISDRDDPGDVLSALNFGIRGYIPTSIAPEVAIAALSLIEMGGTYIPAGALRSEAMEIKSKSENDEQVRLSEELSLTSRELAVIDLLREGNANKVIANKLKMSESTVKVHVRNILKKLRASNRTHAATMANRLFANSYPVLSQDDLSNEVQ